LATRYGVILREFAEKGEVLRVYEKCNYGHRFWTSCDGGWRHIDVHAANKEWGIIEKLFN
jgi:hypothetical protein